MNTARSEEVEESCAIFDVNHCGEVGLERIWGILREISMSHDELDIPGID
jgi:hypothetical protein